MDNANAKALADVLALLDLEQIEEDIFRGGSQAHRVKRVFGGQVLGQALAAASRTVDPSRICHSFHAYFLRAGDPQTPILYEVDRARDGQSFSARRVVAIQHGKQIFNFAASYQVTESGFEHDF
jgi:acyl-CoA thioesterase-2